MERPMRHRDVLEAQLGLLADDIVANAAEDLEVNDPGPSRSSAEGKVHDSEVVPRRGIRPTLSANGMMSARNSSFWLQVVAQSHSDPSLQTSSRSLRCSVRVDSVVENASTVATHDSVREEDTSEAIPEADEIIYEHERYQILLGWGAKGCLLPMDPKRYTNATYSTHYPIFPTIALPKPSTDGTWEWTSPWQIQIVPNVTDKDGWKYASSFNHLRQNNPSACSPTYRSTTFTRRRTWMRRREFVPVGRRQSMHAHANIGLDDTQLDRKSGWLYKQGHILKNWKRRFFVLDGSVLRYFSEDVDATVPKSTTHKLKGEVLLFHKDTTVHYVDIHLSGRDFTFAIDTSGGGFSLMLQASSLDEREDWIYAIEDAILCRESYQDSSGTELKQNVERRRSLTRVAVPPRPTKIVCDRIVKAHTENIRNFIATFQLHYDKLPTHECVQAKVLSAIKSFRMFMERILAKVLERYRDYMVQIKQEAQIEHNYADARDTALIQIERLTFIPLQDVLYNLLLVSTGEESVRVFETKRRYLSRQSQAFFDIQPNHMSPSNWRTAIVQLNQMDNYSLPFEKGQALMEAATSIYTLHAMEHDTPTSMPNTSPHLAADDFLPIFIYVVCQSRLRQVLLTRRIVSETMISSVAMGEVGYYSTMLEAAVEFIALFELPTESKKGKSPTNTPPSI
ncbi:hypothetical protein H310_13627 [Aphanomyces invadans]|uniref:VPS9 domain-containing protein n=1 Tax=Aphanomyces invadans TaxID=157072 RepID=A0A024TCW2_9STRA|nr:hypothetical protein H310_13627 [Aphanomyces invadans]ETV91990.1 hypothetical protein H310_13627 [Aphanomyces invadans]|eukprot:XP_008879414.1 hypothetical protein H310_13627 [Aphanomyces invadans]